MNESKDIENFCSRTDRKLRFAQVHLEELKVKGISNGDDFDRAHQESFVYHLLGAKEAFLIELNAYYRTELKDQEISMGNLKKALEKKGMQGNELLDKQSEIGWSKCLQLQASIFILSTSKAIVSSYSYTGDGLLLQRHLVRIRSAIREKFLLHSGSKRTALGFVLLMHGTRTFPLRNRMRHVLTK